MATPILGRLPTPPHWRMPSNEIDLGSRTGRRIAWTVVAVSVVVLIFVQTRYLPAVVFAPLIVSASYLADFLYDKHWWRFQIPSTRHGTLLRNDLSDLADQVEFMAAGIATFLGYVTVQAMGIPVPDVVLSGRRGSSIVHADSVARHALAIGLVLLACAAIFVLVKWWRTSRDSLLMTAEGIAIRRFPKSQSIAWDALLNVSDSLEECRAGVSSFAETESPIILVMRDGSPPVIVNGQKYTPKGDALFWMLLHYWSTPQRRDELGNGVARNRLLEEDFPVIDFPTSRFGD